MQTEFFNFSKAYCEPDETTGKNGVNGKTCKNIFHFEYAEWVMVQYSDPSVYHSFQIEKPFFSFLCYLNNNIKNNINKDVN